MLPKNALQTEKSIAAIRPTYVIDILVGLFAARLVQLIIF